MSALDSEWYVEGNGVRTRNGYVCFIDDASVTVPRGDRPAILACLAAAPKMLAKLHEIAKECANCHGDRAVQHSGPPGPMGPPDPDPCADCADIWSVIDAAEGVRRAAS